MNKFTAKSLVDHFQMATPMPQKSNHFVVMLLMILSFLIFMQPASAEPFGKSPGNGFDMKRFDKESKRQLIAETNRINKPWKQQQRNNSKGWQKSKSDNEYFSNKRRSNKDSGQDSSQYLKDEQSYPQEKRKYNTSRSDRGQNDRDNTYYYKKHNKNKSSTTYTPSPYDKFSSDWNRTKKIHSDKWKNHDGNDNVNYPTHKRYPTSVSRHRHSDRHLHDYKIYNRSKYVYYRTPWYSTRYFAPVHVHYHRTGYRVSYLPERHVRIVVNSVPYFYYSGMFYRPYGGSYVVVSAPIGAYVSTLPIDFIAFSIGLSTYYYVNDTYYLWDEPQKAYVVVDKPEGADSAIEEATSERLFAYPKAGQSEEQQAKDRYECHRWGVEASGVDPTIEDQEYTSSENDNYKRAMSACLEGRQYAVK